MMRLAFHVGDVTDRKLVFATTLTHHVIGVVFVGSEKKMFRINTKAIVAFMAHF